MRWTRPKPDEVFTPRAAIINPEMYIQRHDLERALQEALTSQLHIVIHGESGTGKSWLYKKVLTDTNAHFEVANLANASRLGSITEELRNVVSRHGSANKVGYEEDKSAGLNVAIASGSLSHTGQFQVGQKEPFEACLASIRHAAGRRLGVLVLDNLEAAFTGVLLKELADLLILCDDERYAEYKVHVLIVGVPSGIKEYYYKTPHHATVGNRIREIPEVSRLTSEQCRLLAERGFAKKLKYTIPTAEDVYRHVAWVTDRIPQMIHEYCLEVAKLAENSNRTITTDILRDADKCWISQSMYHGYAVVEQHMNERDTKAGRRNQTLFALSRSGEEQVKAPEIEDVIRREFPNSTQGTTLNIPQILGQLASGDRPVIRRSPKGDAFQFADPRYRMVLRAMLTKTADERVEKTPLASG